MENSYSLIACAGPDDNDRRADRIFRKIFPSLSLGRIYMEMRKGSIRVNSRKIAPGTRINTGDRLEIHNSLLESIRNDIENVRKNESGNRCAGKKTFKPEIIFENSNFAAVNKPAGIQVHPGSKKGETGDNSRDRKLVSGICLDEAFRACYSRKSGRSVSFAPSPLHRLDKNTSGIVVFGLTLEGARLFTRLLREKRVAKNYVLVLEGKLTMRCSWSDRLEHDEDRGMAVVSGKPDGRESVTEIIPLAWTAPDQSKVSGYKDCTLAAARIPTGTYHQIRKQCSMHGHPLAGDVKYGASGNPGNAAPPFLLHCLSIKIAGKGDAEETGFDSISAPLPGYFTKAVSSLFKINEKDIEELLRPFL